LDSHYLELCGLKIFKKYELKEYKTEQLIDFKRDCYSARSSKDAEKFLLVHEMLNKLFEHGNHKTIKVYKSEE